MDLPRRPATAGRRCSAIRPEQVALHALPAGATLPLKVSVVEPMGADTLVWGAIGRDTISVRVGPDETFAVGQDLSANFLLDHASLFDAESGDRL